MAFRKKRVIRARPIRRKRVVPKLTQKVRVMSGQAPETKAEKIARYAGAGIGLAALALQVARQQGLTNVETKYIDTTFSSVAIDNTGNQTYLLNDCAEGDDISQRNGRWILDKGLQYRLRFVGDANAITTAVGYALVYIKDFAQVNVVGAGLAWTDIFNSTDPQALINKNVSDNYVILKRGIVFMDVNGKNQALLNGYVNLKGIHTKYNATTTGAFQKGALALMFVSDHGAAAQPPHLNGTARFTFHDN